MIPAPMSTTAEYPRRMDRPPGVPAEFDVRTVVFLIRPDNPPAFDEDALDALQVQHLAFVADLASRGITAANGPMRDQTDVRVRGISVYTVGVDEALAIAREDPMVRAGWLRLEAAQWCVAAGKIAFPMHDGPVGEVVGFDDL